MTDQEFNLKQQQFHIAEALSHLNKASVGFQIINTTILPDMTMKQLAKRWDTSRSTITRALQAGRIVLKVINEGIGRGEEKIFSGFSIQVAEMHGSERTIVKMKNL